MPTRTADARPIRLVLALLVAAMLTPLASAQATLHSRVDRVLRASGLDAARVGVVVLDGDSGRALVSINPDEALIPASNMKVITSGAAATILGEDFAFRTELILDGERLIVRGAGDPALADPELLREMRLSADEFLQVWVSAIEKTGRRVREIVVDDRAFDRELFHPTWPADQLNRWYCAQVSGLNFHANVLSVYAQPTTGGAAPAVSVEPAASFIDLTNRAQTRTDGTNTIWVSRPNLANQFTVHGNVRYALAQPVEVALHDPARFLGDLLAERLARAGTPRPSVRLADEGERFEGGEVVAVVRSPLEVILRRCNVSSHNLYAEALLKRLSHEVTGTPGSWTGGAAVLRMSMQRRLGPNLAAGVQIADGSGMSRENRVSANALARWLASFDPGDPRERLFIESLPRAGQDGTLRNRFQGKDPTHEIRAKTGYIRNVSTLSGYVTDNSTGRRLVFSILVNDFPANVSLAAIRQAQDEIVMHIDRALTERVLNDRALGGD